MDITTILKDKYDEQLGNGATSPEAKQVFKDLCALVQSVPAMMVTYIVEKNPDIAFTAATEDIKSALREAWVYTCAQIPPRPLRYKQCVRQFERLMGGASGIENMPIANGPDVFQVDAITEHAFDAVLALISTASGISETSPAEFLNIADADVASFFVTTAVTYMQWGNIANSQVRLTQIRAQFIEANMKGAISQMPAIAYDNAYKADAEPSVEPSVESRGVVTGADATRDKLVKLQETQQHICVRLGRYYFRK